MAKKPSERRNYKDEGMELNLTPMMNLIAILIPVLLVSTAFVEIAVLNVAAPAIGSTPQTKKPEKKPDKPPLNLTVTITDKGYTLSASGSVMPGPKGKKGPTIPVTEKAVNCQRYINNWPPPRNRNRGAQRCERGDEQSERPFLVYDTSVLTDKLVDIKDNYPDERRIIIQAEPDVEYEAITDVMDASREIKDATGEARALFDEVVLSPGLT